MGSSCPLSVECGVMDQGGEALVSEQIKLVALGLSWGSPTTPSAAPPLPVQPYHSQCTPLKIEGEAWERDRRSKTALPCSEALGSSSLRFFVCFVFIGKR